MIKKLLAGAALAASVVAVGATASPAMALDDGTGTTAAIGDGALQKYGDTVTSGAEGPRINLVQGALDQPCVALPVRTNARSLGAVTPIAVQGINALASQQQQCGGSSAPAQGVATPAQVLGDSPAGSGATTG
ncbi:rodlin [Streptomyces sp. NPDC049040]|uniref:rodlin n=1 Tax=Streptomyces sp. NPDC049040 TaxID=3365593 RepID=UPI0037184E2D